MSELDEPTADEINKFIEEYDKGMHPVSEADLTALKRNAFGRFLRERSRAEKAEAACAEMRECIRYFAQGDPIADHAFSLDCGKGWLSPEKAKRLRDVNSAYRHAILEILEWAQSAQKEWLEACDITVPISYCEDALEKSKRAIEETEDQ